MLREPATQVTILLAALFIGCASAPDAADEEGPNEAAAAPSGPGASSGMSASAVAAQPAMGSGAAEAASSSFAVDILPILNANCGSCHASGVLPRFAARDADAAYAVAQNLSAEMLSRLDAGTMPPTCSRQSPGASGCISVADFEQIERWVQADAPE